MRLTGFLQWLAKDHEVVCCFPRMTSEAEAALERIGVAATGCIFRPQNVSKWWRAPAQVVLSSPWKVPPTLLREADVIHLSTVRSAPLVPRSILARCHLDYVDALSGNTFQRAESARWLGPFWMSEARRLQRLEMELGSMVRTATCTTSEDARAIGRPGTVVVPFGVTGPASPTAPSPTPVVAFTGNLGYFANVDAAEWLAREIFPKVRNAVPECRLTVVGARPTRSVRKLALLPGVEVHADVPSISPHLSSAWVVACPLRLGTGLQTKVLEAMANWRPVVTTPAVARRIEGALPGVNLEVGETAADQAHLVVRLLLDRALSAEIASAGKSLANHYRWERCASALEAAYDR